MESLKFKNVKVGNSSRYFVPSPVTFVLDRSRYSNRVRSDRYERSWSVIPGPVRQSVSMSVIVPMNRSASSATGAHKLTLHESHVWQVSKIA